LTEISCIPAGYTIVLLLGGVSMATCSHLYNQLDQGGCIGCQSVLWMPVQGTTYLV